ncbi:HD domain-containing protein [Mucilaginibacter agri]|uniref:Phosphohydrolase n=1 Tax=Mucilaginibacter agri TaxID=2695265 RepID=A0A965ZMK2_9SPHI|nr:phosphohydrolase [Mucilaginibacter agri]NCD72466.1 phosphohydrolase [Mucilaginibacter agri]
MELPKHLSYHSVDHIEDVYNAAQQLGKAEGIDAHQMKLLLTAAWYHDSGFLKGAKDHEIESCKIAKESLINFGYNAADIDTICGMIMATKIPQTPKNHLEEILADADLDYLGRDDFFTIGNKLFTELSVFGFLDNEDDWNRLQVRFLESHHYFTKSALASRQAQKELHLKQIKLKLNNKI